MGMEGGNQYMNKTLARQETINTIDGDGLAAV